MTEQEWLSEFGANLARMLEECHMSQNDLARETGLARSTISRYINAQQMPNVKALINIAEVLECGFSDLLYFGDTIV